MQHNEAEFVNTILCVTCVTAHTLLSGSVVADDEMLHHNTSEIENAYWGCLYGRRNVYWSVGSYLK